MREDYAIEKEYMTSIKLSDIAESRVNNLNLMRLLSAEMQEILYAVIRQADLPLAVWRSVFSLYLEDFL